MKWDADNPFAPFDEDGSLLSYLGFGTWLKWSWKPAGPFWAVLTLNHLSRGRSSLLYYWKDDAGRTYPMFPTDLEDLLRRGAIHKGVTPHYQWKIVKRGQNYGIKLADD